MRRWEYQYIDEEEIDKVNELGKEGWRVIHRSPWRGNLCLERELSDDTLRAESTSPRRSGGIHA